MIRNIKRTAAIFGAIAISSTALVACSESSDGAAGAEGGEDISGSLSGEGASSQKNAMGVFEAAFLEKYPDADFSYTSSGSGAGVEAFLGSTVAFAGSDSPLDAEDGEVEAANERCGGNDAWHLPSVIGPVAIAYNLGDTQVNLDVETLAKIFKGEITQWNDPAIAAANPDAQLPDTKITVIFRSDESGTSDNFQKFLAASTDGLWEGSGKQFPDSVGEGANGSSGVADQVAAIEGAITYVEAGYAHQKEADGVKIAAIDFGNGPVELSNETVGAALDNLAFTETNSEHDMVVDSEALFASDAPGSYPLILTTYNIVCSAGYDEETAALVKAFFKTALENQNETLEGEGFIPVSGAHLERLQSAVDALA